MKVKYRKTWKNTIKRYKAQPLKFIEPESLEDIRDIIKEAEMLGRRVRAVGSGHSFSDVAVGADYLVDIKRLNKIKEIPEKWLRDPAEAEFLAQTEAGITLQRFNRLMDKTRNLCVTNMGAVDNQTIAGAISTGTHGSGIDLPAIHGMIRSIVIVSHGGKVFRIEPSGGITDPDSYDEGFELIQDDDIFNSIVVSFGCMGVIYAVTLKLEKMYWLQESKKEMKWSEARAKLADRSWFEKPGCDGDVCRSVSVILNPYKKRKENDHTCVVVRQRLLNTRPHRSIGDRTRNFFSSIFAQIRLPIWITRLLIQITPGLTAWTIGASLKSLLDVRYENKGYKVLHQGLEWLKLGAYDCELAFDMKDNRFLDAIDAMIDMVKELSEDYRLFPNAPLGIRFVKASTAYMCPDFGKNVCYVDTPVLTNTTGGDAIIEHYQETCFKFDGIPHWGKIHYRIYDDPERIKKYYPKLDAWGAVFRKFNPKGTFNARLSDRLEDLGLIANVPAPRKRAGAGSAV